MAGICFLACAERFGAISNSQSSLKLYYPNKFWDVFFTGLWTFLLMDNFYFHAWKWTLLMLRSQFVHTNVILDLGASKPLKNVCLLIKIHIKKDFPFTSLLKLYIWSDTFLLSKTNMLFHFFHDIHFGSMIENQLLL